MKRGPYKKADPLEPLRDKVIRQASDIHWIKNDVNVLSKRIDDLREVLQQRETETVANTERLEKHFLGLFHTLSDKIAELESSFIKAQEILQPKGNKAGNFISHDASSGWWSFTDFYGTKWKIIPTGDRETPLAISRA